MSETDLKRIEEQLAAIRRAMEARSLPQVLTLQEAARQLSVGMTTLRQMIKRGQIHPTGEKIGGRRQIPLSEVLRLATPAPRGVTKPKRALARRSPATDSEDLKEWLKTQRKKR